MDRLRLCGWGDAGRSERLRLRLRLGVLRSAVDSVTDPLRVGFAVLRTVSLRFDCDERRFSGVLGSGFKTAVRDTRWEHDLERDRLGGLRSKKLASDFPNDEASWSFDFDRDRDLYGFLEGRAPGDRALLDRDFPEVLSVGSWVGLSSAELPVEFRRRVLDRRHDPLSSSSLFFLDSGVLDRL